MAASHFAALNLSATLFNLSCAETPALSIGNNSTGADGAAGLSPHIESTILADTGLRFTPFSANAFTSRDVCSFGSYPMTAPGAFAAIHSAGDIWVLSPVSNCDESICCFNWIVYRPSLMTIAFSFSTITIPADPVNPEIQPSLLALSGIYSP